MTTTTNLASWTATLDHRTGLTVGGGPASPYHRVARCDGRRPAGLSARFGNQPNYAARRLGALLFALSAVMAGTWLVGEVAGGLAGQPASAAAPAADSSGVHVARSGDTLWSIAEDHRANISRDSYVDALVALNGGTAIHIGQAVHLP